MLHPALRFLLITHRPDMCEVIGYLHRAFNPKLVSEPMP